MHQIKALSQKSWFLPVVVSMGWVLRFCLCSLGHNYDFDSYLIVGDIVANGGNVYAQTSRYNYAPLFFLVQGLLYKLSLLSSTPSFCYRLLMVSFLSAADLGLMFYVNKKAGSFWAAVFFLNPISLIISGYHNQFDNWAVLLAIVGIEFAAVGNDSENADRWNRSDACSIFFLSLSLIMKHILYAFPLWLLFSQKISKKKKLVYSFVPPFVFLLSFLPFAGQGFEGILNNVFLYRSANNFPLLGVGMLKHFFPGWAGLHHSVILFAALIAAAGWLAKRESLSDLLLLYLIALVCFSSAIANQYLAIPAVAVILLLKKQSFWYFGTGCIYLLLEGNGLHLYSTVIQKLFSPGSFPELVFHVLSTGTVMYSVFAWILFVYLLCLFKARRLLIRA